DCQVLRLARGQIEGRQIFGDVLRQGRNPRRLLAIGRIEPQHVTIVLDRRPTTGRGYDDRVEATIVDLAGPDVHITSGEIESWVFLAHVVDKSSAAALSFRNDDFHAEAGQQADGRLVDAGIKHRLGAAGKDGDTTPALRLRRTWMDMIGVIGSD